MISAILKIRLTQAYRSISGIGLLRVAFLAVLGVLLMAFVYRQLQGSNSGMVLVAGLLGLVFYIHIRRTDKVFLDMLHPRVQRLYFAEYFMFTLPVLVLSIASLHFDLAGIHLLGLVLISFLRISLISSKINLNNRVLKSIPHPNFEMKAGFRANFYFLFPLNILALVFSFWVGTLPVVLLINTLAVSGFYQLCESRQMLEAGELPPVLFIQNKILSNLKVYAAIQLPLSAVFVALHPAYYFVALAILAVGVLYLVYGILLKYALYVPQADLRGNAIIMGIALFLLPILLVMIPVYYFKAVNNLNTYLNDFH